MSEERNKHQITRKDARGCFVESLNDVFAIGKTHFAFASYDLSKPAGQRQECGELRYLTHRCSDSGARTV